MKTTKKDAVYEFPETEDNLNCRTAVLAEFVGKFHQAALPANVVEQTRALIIDTIAAAFAGVETKCALITRQVAETLGGQAQASVIGRRKKRRSRWPGWLTPRWPMPWTWTIVI